MPVNACSLVVMRKTVVVLFVLSFGFPALASAQAEGGPDPSKVRVRIGPLLLNPSIGLSNIGVDTNVFNESNDQQPKSDFTLTVVPRTDIWLPLGRSWLSGTIDEQIVWYQKYESERSANNRLGIGWRMLANVVNINLGATYNNTNERPGYEIDVRAPRTDLMLQAAFEGRVLSRTFLGVRVLRQTNDFDDTTVFADALLRDQLNRVSTSAAVTLRQQLTPLTSIEFNGTRTEDEFEFSPLRDSVSSSFNGTVTFDPLALIRGSATFGIRDFKPESPDVPGFTGGTMAVDLAYTLLGSTRFTVRATRDIQYSFDITQPYYLQTGIDFSLAQQIYGPMDAVVRISEQSLAYRNRAGVPQLDADRTDRVHSYGFGSGYHFGTDLRLAFNVDNVRRTSDIDARTYEGWKYGAALTYGF
jgi:putative beta-barrel porin BBP2